jgi:lipoprotein-releasing system permease protein
VSLLSIAGIAIGVAALLILHAFMDGFSGTIMEHLAAIQPPLEVRAPGGYPVEEADLLFVENLADSLDELTCVSPVLEKTAVAAGSSGDVAGVRIRGVDWDVEPSLVSSDRLDKMNITGRGAVLGHSLATRLGVSAGDSIRLASTDLTEFSAMGRLLVDTIVSARVCAVINYGIEEYNSSIILTDLITASFLFGEDITATSLSVGTAPGYDPLHTAEKVTAILRASYINGECNYMVCDAFISRHRNLFAALGLEKTGMSIVLALISFVALLNLLSALNMIALEHRRDTGVLRAMGASPGAVLFTGLMQGGIIGLAGALSGSLFAVMTIFVINRVFPIRLESSVYWIDVLPGEIQPVLILCIGGATVFACLFASLIPAVYALSVSPSKAVRYE